MRTQNIAAICLLLCVAFCGPGHSQTGLSVISYSPPAHAMVDPNQLQIVVDFDMPVDAASITSKSFAVFGRWSGVCQGQYFLEDENRRVRFVADKPASAGEWITVSLSKQIHSETDDNLGAGFAWNFWTRSAAAAMRLEKKQVIDVRQNNESPIRTYGAYAGDLDGDGFHDFTVPNEVASDVRVFMNDGFGGYRDFEIYSLPANSTPSTNEGADFNNDGFLDFACGNIDGGAVSVLLGAGDGTFLPHTTYPVAAGTRGLAVVDLNGDGAPDIVTANRAAGNMAKLINQGDGTFSEAVIFQARTERETACAAADFNEDGILDVAVGSFSGQNLGEIVIMTGDGDGNLSFSSATSARGDCWMLAVGDMDNDGHVDVVSANALQNQFAYFRGLGNGSVETGRVYDVGEFPLAIDAGDIDGDGDLDVVTSNFGTGNWTLYENDGEGNFTNPYTLQTELAGSCAVLHDRDRDGDLDMTGIDEIGDTIILFENPGSPSAVEGGVTASDFQLAPSYPNPFSKAGNSGGQGITIPLTLNRDAPVTVDLYNIRGQKIETLIQRQMTAGRHHIRFSPKDIPAGVYFYSLISGNTQAAGKLVLWP